MTLQDMREENSGYNPEEKSMYDFNYEHDQYGVTTAVDEEGCRYEEVTCKTEEEYINEFPRTYGIIINNVFYRSV